jgi:hypothetical protein
VLNQKEKIEFIAGYYEFSLYINDLFIYCISLDDPIESWGECKTESDCKNLAEETVNAILYELMENNEELKREILQRNKTEVIKVVADTIMEYKIDRE